MIAPEKIDASGVVGDGSNGGCGRGVALGRVVLPAPGPSPAEVSVSSKELFNKFKSRPEGTNAGFILVEGAEIEVIDPTKMRSLNAVKLRQRMKKKGVAGTFYKGPKGPIFSVMAGKQGGKPDQPWVTQTLRRELGVSSLEVIEAAGADLEEEVAPTSPTSSDSAPSITGVSDDMLGGLNLLDLPDDGLGDSLEAIPDDLSGLLDVLDLPDEGAFQEHRKKVVPVLAALDAAAKRLAALKDKDGATYTKAHGTWTSRLEELDELATTEPTEADGKLAGVLGGSTGARDKALEAVVARVKALKEAAQQAVSTLKSDPKSGWLGSDLTKLEQQVAAGQSALDDDPGKAHEIWTALPATCATAIDDNDAYQKYLVKAQTLTTALYKLEDHLHKEHVRAEITTAEDALHAAHLKAEQGKATEADTKLELAKSTTTLATTYLGKYQTYRTARAPVYEAARVMDSAQETPEWVAMVENADAATTPPNREYDDATNFLNAVKGLIEDKLTAWYVTETGNDRSAVTGGDCADYVSDETDKVAALVLKVQSNIAEGKYLKALLKGGQADSLVTSAKRLVKRRKVYEDQRALTITALLKAEENSRLMGQCFSLRKVIDKADELASRKTMRIEQGTVLATNCEDTAKQLLQVGKDARAYWPELKKAENRIAALKEHDAASLIDENLKAAAALIASSLIEAGVPPGPKHDDDVAPIKEDFESQDYAAAKATIDRAASELDAAESIIKATAGSVELVGKADDAGDEGAVRDVVKALRERLAVVNQSPHKGLVEDERWDVADSCDESLHQLTEGRVGIAKVSLKGAAELLVICETVITEHAHFLAIHKVEEDRRDQLLARTSAVKNAAKIAAVTRWLDKATEQAGERDYATATKSVRLAAIAAEEAEVYAEQRERYDARRGTPAPSATGLWDEVEKLQDGGLEAAARDLMAKADQAADAFEFEQARKLLDEVESKAKLHDMMDWASNPAHPDLVDHAKALMKLDGGTKALDDFIAQLPVSQGSFALMQSLARERFDISLESDAGWRSATAKQLWAMMAKCPEADVQLNPSLKVVRRENPGKHGGYYQSSEDLVVMNGRPQTSPYQTFGSQLKNSAGEDQLGEVDDKYKIEDETAVKYFDWATLHEVGHAVDDRLGFMDSREGDGKFGDWTSYGKSVNPIARAVAATHGSDADKLYVYAAALLNQRDTTDVPEPDDYAGDWSADTKKVDDWYAIATRKDIYRSEGDSQKIVLSDGYIYQEAYKGSWVRYLASARKKGLTGYQFRAPGEWFAELYAAYHSDKLKKGHPSRAWLGSL